MNNRRSFIAKSITALVAAFTGAGISKADAGVAKHQMLPYRRLKPEGLTWDERFKIYQELLKPSVINRETLPILHGNRARYEMTGGTWERDEDLKLSTLSFGRSVDYHFVTGDSRAQWLVGDQYLELYYEREGGGIYRLDLGQRDPAVSEDERIRRDKESPGECNTRFAGSAVQDYLKTRCPLNLDDADLLDRYRCFKEGKRYARPTINPHKVHALPFPVEYQNFSLPSTPGT